MSPKRSRPQNNPPATQSRSSHPIRSVAGLVFLVAVAIGAPPLMHFSRQASSGSPLDPAYFRREFSWQRFLKLGLYNGEGGEDWSIGEPLAELRSADRKQRLPELRVFALQLVNRDRAINGLPPLLPDPDLDVAAQFHAQDMYDRDYFDHVSPEGLSALDRYLSIRACHQIEGLTKRQDAKPLS